MAETRRQAVGKLLKSASFISVGGLFWGSYLGNVKANELVLRPPAALAEKDFLKACVKCGVCVEACPYDTLKLATPRDNLALGTPFFEPRKIACEMCVDIPCVPACPTGALDINLVSSLNEENETVLDINKAQMGAAIIDSESCIAFWGIQCDLCYRACPLIDEAIFLEYTRNERTGKHAFLKPVVNNDICTGCGLCEHACVTEKAAIRVLPRSLVTGKAGDHYIKGWDEADEQRLQGKEGVELDDTEQKTLDYLNDMEGIIDEN